MTTFSLLTPLGRVTLEPVDPGEHTDLLHTWVTHDKAGFWGMQGFTLAQTREEFEAIDADPHHDAWLGRLEGQAVFLAETYDPGHSVLAAHYPVRRGDLGMHVLLAPADSPVHGLTSQVFRAVMHFCFRDPATERVVVEPDVANGAVHAKNAAAGFRPDGVITLPEKDALLSFCTLADFLGSDLEALGERRDPQLAHLEPGVVARAHRHLAAKALGEFSHERLLRPEPAGQGRWAVSAGAARYTFTATRHALEHWRIDPTSIERTVAGRPERVDALETVSDLHADLGIPDHLRSTYLEELSGTLASLAYCWHHERHSSRDLAHADFQTVEAAMSEGHPAFVAGSGRIGFSAGDHAAYAPEAGADVRLVWIAVRRSASHLSLAAGSTEDDFYDGVIGQADRARFDRRLRAGGADPADYLLLPVHPWQWDHKLAVTFAADIARGDIIGLGRGSDRFRAQQSIRTFFDVDAPQRGYVKTALAIQNMGFVRGLSPAYMRATPAINDWVASVVESDDALAACGFGVLREVAAIGYTGDAYHGLPGRNPHQKMVAALWRESPLPRLAPGQHLMTMAALLHRDAAGVSLLGELIAASGLDAAAWVRAYLWAYLRPVVHCLAVHDLAFMPHGENIILILEGHAPVGAFIKDIGEEVVVTSERELPARVERIRTVLSEEEASLSVLTDVLDGVLRYVAEILTDDGLLAGQEFWDLVAECIHAHAAEYPQVEQLRLLRPQFAHSCLNRLQLRNTLQMVDLADPSGSLILAGELANPLHGAGRRAGAGAS